MKPSRFTRSETSADFQSSFRFRRHRQPYKGNCLRGACGNPGNLTRQLLIPSRSPDRWLDPMVRHYRPARTSEEAAGLGLSRATGQSPAFPLRDGRLHERGLDRRNDAAVGS